MFCIVNGQPLLNATGIPEWQIYYGFIAGLSPFVIAAYEFGKRLLIQRQCELCMGSGLIQKGKYSKKCTSCGGQGRGLTLQHCPSTSNFQLST